MLTFTSVFSSRLCVISIKAAISHPHTIATTLVVSTEAPPTWCSNLLFMRRSQSESGGGELDQLESKRRGWNEGNTDGDYFEMEILQSHSTKAWEKKVELDMGMVGVINCGFCIITYIRLLCAKEIKPCPSALGHLLINVFFVWKEEKARFAAGVTPTSSMCVTVHTAVAVLIWSFKEGFYSDHVISSHFTPEPLPHWGQLCFSDYIDSVLICWLQ